MTEVNEDAVAASINEASVHRDWGDLSFGESTEIRSIKQPTAHPVDKMTGVEHGGVLSLVIVGVLVQFGIEPNPYLAAGIGGASAWIVGYMTKERG